jgi:hypothetical protein
MRWRSTSERQRGHSGDDSQNERKRRGDYQDDRLWCVHLRAAMPAPIVAVAQIERRWVTVEGRLPCLVPEVGLEPTRRVDPRGILSPVRLPIPPLRHQTVSARCPSAVVGHTRLGFWAAVCSMACLTSDRDPIIRRFGATVKMLPEAGCASEGNTAVPGLVSRPLSPWERAGVRAARPPGHARPPLPFPLPPGEGSSVEVAQHKGDAHPPKRASMCGLMRQGWRLAPLPSGENIGGETAWQNSDVHSPEARRRSSPAISSAIDERFPRL